MVSVMKYLLGIGLALMCVAPASAQYYGGHGVHAVRRTFVPTYQFQTVVVPAPVQLVPLPMLTYAVPQVTYAQPLAQPAVALPQPNVVPDVPPIPSVTAAPVAVVPFVQEVVVYQGHYFHWNGRAFNPLTVSQITALRNARGVLRTSILAAKGNAVAINAAHAAFRASLTAAGVPLRRR